MSLNDMGNGGYGTTMLVQPAYGGYPGNYGGGLGGFGGIGGDYAWLLLLIILLGGGMWGGFGGGFGMGGMMWPMMLGGMGAGYGLDYLYPWLNNSQHMSDGFHDQQLQGSIEGVRNAVNNGFSAVQLGQAGISKELCAASRDITGAVRDGFSAAEIAANGRQMASMQQNFAIQSAIERGAAANAAGIADLRYTEAQEGCNTRATMTTVGQQLTMQNVNDTNNIISVMRDGFQNIKDEIFADRLALERRGREEDQREIQQLRTELMFTRGQMSQNDQTAQIGTRIAAEANALYNRAQTCPLPTYAYQPPQPCSCNRSCPGGTLPGLG